MVIRRSMRIFACQQIIFHFWLWGGGRGGIGGTDGVLHIMKSEICKLMCNGYPELFSVMSFFPFCS